MKYDFFIKNGQVFDEEKKGFKIGDIAISGKQIKKINFHLRDDKTDKKSSEEKNSEIVIDAKGKTVAPGFIDLTNHSDTFWTIFESPYQESLLSQGITTILGGNCGMSLAPLVSGSSIDGIRKWADISSININWQSMKELLDELDRHPLGVNFATLVGHGNLRRGIIGDISKTATKTELDKMKLLLERSLKEGAYGVSFNLASAHALDADDKEIEDLSSLVEKYGALAKHHLKDEGKNILPSIVRVINYARISKAKTQISHLKILGKGSWDKFEEIEQVLSNAAEEGVPISFDIFPYTSTGSSLYLFLPDWVRKNGRRDILFLIQDAKERKNIIEYLKSLTLHYDKIVVASALKDKDALGKTIKELSLSTGLSPEDVILDLIMVNDLNVLIFNEAISEDHILNLIKKQNAMPATDGAGYDISGVSGADALGIFSKSYSEENYVHPRSFGTFAKIFKELVKEKQLLSAGELIYKMSSLPAKILGLKDRGELKENSRADIVILNLETIKDNSTYQNPFQFSEGMEWVFVNGVPAIQDSKFTLKTGGEVLRKI